MVEDRVKFLRHQANEFGRMAERSSDPQLREQLYEISRRCEAIAKEMQKSAPAAKPAASD